MQRTALGRWTRYACATLLAITSLSCGGGGGGGGSDSFPGFTPVSESTPMTLSPSSAATTSEMVSFAHSVGNLVGPSGDFVPLSAQPESKEAKAAQALLPTLLAHLRARLHCNPYQAAGSGSESMDCPNGGGIRASFEWVGPDEVSSECEMIDLEGTLTMSDCGLDSNSVMDGSMRIQYSGSPCNATAMYIVLENFTFQFGDSQLLSRRLEISASNLIWYNDSIYSGTTVLNGQAISIEAGAEFAAAFSDFTEIATTFTGDDYYTYISVAVSGGLTGPCVDGWANIQTDPQMPIILSEYSDCPIDGRIIISGDISTNVTFYNDGSVRVGGIDYPSCEDLNLTCPLP